MSLSLFGLTHMPDGGLPGFCCDPLHWGPIMESERNQGLSLLFFITLKPRVEWYRILSSLELSDTEVYEP